MYPGRCGVSTPADREIQVTRDFGAPGEQGGNETRHGDEL